MFDENMVSLEEEERMERQNLLKGLHPKMRLWYNSVPIASIKEKYGMFPPFWQDLEKWEHLKLLRKLYLTATEKTESGSIFDIMELEKSFIDAMYASAVVDTVDVSNEENSKTELSSSGNESQAIKKRRNRWGAAPVEATSTEVSTEGVSPQTVLAESIAAEDAAVKKQRRSTRWSAAEVANVPTFAPIVPLSQEVIQQTMVLKVQLEQIGQRLVTVLQDAVRISLDPSRSPSPPPRYDGAGKRSNTRDVRMKEELIEQRGKIIEELIAINPQFQPPADYIRARPFKRLIIPFREFPTYNFIGLIIGPRGNTQKELELATGCKISIRGKGSSKEGSLGRAGKKNPDDDEELHVHVTADDAAKVEAGAKLIASFLNPIDDEKNDHKQKQLRELALINGTLKEEEYCPVCGEKGHKQFECPHRAKTFKAAGVKCSICGDLSHPTRDCPLKKDEPTNAVALDSEYDSFMAELDGGGRRQSSSSKNEVIMITGEKEKVLPVTTSSSMNHQPLAGVSSSQSFGSLSDERSPLFPPLEISAGLSQGMPKRQQTIIVVTTVLTGVGVSIAGSYHSQHMSAPPAISYATASHNATAPMSVASSISAPWNMPPQPQHPLSYPYPGMSNPPNPNYPPPPMNNGYSQQLQQAPPPWGFNNMPPPPVTATVPPPPPQENPLPPPPGATPYYPQQGIPPNNMNWR